MHASATTCGNVLACPRLRTVAHEYANSSHTYTSAEILCYASTTITSGTKGITAHNRRCGKSVFRSISFIMQCRLHSEKKACLHISVYLEVTYAPISCFIRSSQPFQYNYMFTCHRGYVLCLEMLTRQHTHSSLENT